jgi:hypothetical protein
MIMSFISRILLLLISISIGKSTDLNLHLFDTTSFPLAVCNDGSPSGFYIKTSPSMSNLWIIFQQGGDWCYDEASCKLRTGDLTSSRNWTSKLSKKGMMESSIPQFAKANLVYATYCSSDGWIGNSSVTDLGFGFEFQMRGAEIVNALFRTLVEQFDLGASPKTEVIYAGCSAGGRGVLFNAPRVNKLLSELTKNKINYFGAFIDSGFWVDMLPMHADKSVSFAEQTKRFYAIANTKGNLNPLCEQELRLKEGWKCLFAEYSIKYLDAMNIPNFLNIFQYDAFQLYRNLNLAPGTLPETEAELAYAELLRGKIDEKVDAIAQGNNFFSFLPACFMHCNTETPGWKSLKTEGRSLEQAVFDWFFKMRNQNNFKASARLIEEQCEGFNCGTGCEF